MADVDIHPAFLILIDICKEVGFGTIKELKIQDGIPVIVKYDIKTDLDAVVEVSRRLV